MDAVDPTARVTPNLRTRLAAGEVLIGTFLRLGSAMAAEACARRGLDWLCHDLEHGAAGSDGPAAVAQAVGAAGLPLLVRLDAHDDAAVSRALDLGAAGIVASGATGEAAVEKAARGLGYPPGGSRRLALMTRAAGYGTVDAATLLDPGRRPVLVVVIETRETLADVDAIAAVAGVDVLLLGAMHLSAELGSPGDVAGGAVGSAAARIHAAAVRAGKAAGVVVQTGREARAYRDRGYTFLAVSSEVSVMARGYSRELADLRA